MNGFTSRSENVELPIGPAVEDVVTPFDEALSCIRGKVNPGIIFAVGQVVDATGKESYAEGASGKYVTQGAGEMVQSSLFRAGVTLVNRRDPNIAITETQWGIRDLQQQVPVNFYISGSINSLDFIPGGGISTTVAGVGPRFRQNRILIGLDLTLTDAFTGRIVANVPLQKQIFSQEVGTSVGRFFGDTLISFDAGGMEREALHFTLRQMLSLATLQLLGQLMNEEAFAPCIQQISPVFGRVNPIPLPMQNFVQASLNSSQQARERLGEMQAQEEQAAAQQATARAQTAQTVQTQLAEITNQTTIYAVRSIGAAEKSLAAETRDVQAQSAAESMQLAATAGQLLQRAAQLGLSGAEGDAAAIVVERAIDLATQANDALAATAPQAAVPAPVVPTPAPQTPPSGPPAAAGQQPTGLPPQRSTATPGEAATPFSPAR
ncbi:MULTISPECIES: CsgG/HfaB family protein [unclassified Yoonia]|uniref:CsgG/HfaB family protein n=1 Tax=unclassified Yoonia TaxID=2629118 RepID=UPI002AFF4C85|nr:MULTISPECIES: CsgG/HfaB family protein [unclassified Yoonia]